MESAEQHVSEREREREDFVHTWICVSKADECVETWEKKRENQSGAAWIQWNGTVSAEDGSSSTGSLQF